MATYNKFNAFVEHVNEGVHNLQSHTLKVMLLNAAPSASDSVKADLVADEISGGFGYTTGGHAVTVPAPSQTGGVFKLVGNDLTITASGGSIGPFRYAVLYNDTPTSPADPLIAWWDNGSNITLAADESVTINFDDANGIFQMS